MERDLRERRKKAPVWRYYDDSDSSLTANGKYRCRICDFPVKHSGNTTNLMRHLKSKHADEVDLSDSSGDASFQQGSAKRAVAKTENKALLDQFMSMVADDLKPETSGTNPNESTNNSPPRDRRHQRKKRSPIWQYFDAKPGNMEAICSLCMECLRYHGNSTNLLKHLRAKHIAEAASIQTESGSVIRPTYATGTPFSLSSIVPLVPKLKNGDHSTIHTAIPNKIPHLAKSKLFNQKVLAMIINDLHPVSVVDSKSFIDLMHLAEPRYPLPSGKKITTELLPNLYKEVVDRVFKRLEDIQHIALTTELWSPRDQESHLAVTAHFISPTEWTLESIMLSTTAFYGSPSGRHITRELERTVNEWNIAHKVRVMVTDQETNALLANEQLPWAYIPCLAHLIHFVVTDAITADDRAIDLIDKVRGIVRYFKEDMDKKEKLTEVQRSLSLPEHKLILCVPTRWNSTFLMLERMYEQMDAVNTVLQAYDKLDMCLSAEDGDILKMVIASLKPFEIATKTISSEKSTTIGTTLPLIKGLLRMMNSVSGGKEPLSTKLKEGLNESFGKIEDIEWVVTATVLDPRFKKFPYTDRDVIEKATQIIASEISSICQPDPNMAGNSSNTIAKSEEVDSLWMYLDGMPGPGGQREKEPQPMMSANLELQRYLEAAPIPRDESPLVYWKHHQELFPTLCKVAMKYMAVPVTSVPCERLFTKAGEALMEKRSKLKAKNINMILFLNMNMPTLVKNVNLF